MKKLILLTLVAIFMPAFLFAQEACLVLKPQIANRYDGECKNGLAHGKGIASGLDRYEG